MSSPCLICKRLTFTLHSHHVYMQSLNGADSPTIDICGDCHTGLHSIASRIVKIIRTKKGTRVYWPTDRPEAEQEQANGYIACLVKEIMSIDTSELPKLVSVKLDAPINQALKMYQKDFGITNKSQAIKGMIIHALQSKGYLV